MLGETAESPPQERRNSPCSHAELAGCGSDTEWDVPDVACCKLIGKEGEGVSACCVLFLEERVSLKLLRQGMSPTVDVDPVHGCEYCYLKALLLQYPELRVYDLLNGAAIMEFWDVIRLPSHKQRCECCK